MLLFKESGERWQGLVGEGMVAGPITGMLPREGENAIGFVTHKLLHGTLGAGMETILNDSPDGHDCRGCWCYGCRNLC